MQTRQQKRTVEPGSLQEKCIDTFLHSFPGGFTDAKYIATERKTLENAHLLWQKTLGRRKFSDLLNKGEYADIASGAVRIISKTNLLTNEEFKRLRDSVKSEGGARIFSIGLYNYLYGEGTRRNHFDTLVRVLETLPHKEGSVLTWPVQTVFGFIARPARHMIVLPAVIIKAAEKYGFEISYCQRPNWDTYESVLGFAAQVVKDIKFLKPRDMIDLHCFIKLLGLGACSF